MDILATIEKYGLSVRQIPNKLTGLYEARHYEEGDELIWLHITPPGDYNVIKEKLGSNPTYKFDDSDNTIMKQYTRRIEIPENAGYWMCQQFNSTSSMIQWSKKTDNLAATLPESVAMFFRTYDRKIKGYRIWFNDVLDKFVIDHSLTGSALACFSELSDAVEYCEKG